MSRPTLTGLELVFDTGFVSISSKRHPIHPMKFSFFPIVFLGCSLLSHSQPAADVSLSEFGLTFLPDYTFKGSSLDGWHVLGDAEWQSNNGELVGKTASTGGWLVFDEEYQDIGFHAKFKSTGDTETAVLLRMEKEELVKEASYMQLVDEAEVGR